MSDGPFGVLQSAEQMREYLDHLVKVWPVRPAVPGALTLVSLGLAEAAIRTGTLYVLVGALDRCMELEREPRAEARMASRHFMAEYVGRCLRWSRGEVDQTPDWWSGLLVSRPQASRRGDPPPASFRPASGEFHWEMPLAPEAAALASFRDFLVAYGAGLLALAQSADLTEELRARALAWTGTYLIPDPVRNFCSPPLPVCSSPPQPEMAWQRGSAPRPLWALGRWQYHYPLPKVIPGSYQVAFGSGSEVHVRDLSTGEPVATFKHSDDHLAHLDATPDGRLLVACDQERWTAWDLRRGTVVNEGRCHDTPISALAVAPDGSVAFSAGSWENKENEDQLERCRIFGTHVDPGGKWFELEGHFADVLAMVVSPDGKQLLAGDEDGVLRLWRLYATVGSSLLPGPGEVAVTRVVADGRWRLAASNYANYEVRIWNLPDGTLRHVLPAGSHGGFLDIWLSPSGDRLLGLMRDGCLTKWLLEPEPRLFRCAPLGDLYRWFSPLPDARLMALTRWDGFSSVWELGQEW